MRLFSVITASLIVAPALVSAQVKPPARFGLTAGINSSTVSGDDIQDASRRTGLMAGVLLVAPINATWSFQPELLYTMKGAKFDDAGATGTVKMNYIEVPVLLRWDVATATTSAAKPFLYAGPAISFKASCKVKAEFQGQSAEADCDDSSVDSKVKSVDYGVIIGAGLGFKVSGNTFTVGARYNHSLADISEDGNAKHRVISVLATFEFPWGK